LAANTGQIMVDLDHPRSWAAPGIPAENDVVDPQLSPRTEKIPPFIGRCQRSAEPGSSFCPRQIFSSRQPLGSPQNRLPVNAGWPNDGLPIPDVGAGVQ